MTIRIAICDDHPFFRAGLSGVLRAEEDLDVLIEAGSIDELTCGLANVDVDLVLLDVELPDQSGLDALPELSRARRVLMLSAFDDPRRVRQAMQSGALGFLRKDSAPREVIRGIRDAAAGKTVLSAEMAISLAEALRADPDEREFRRRVAAFTPRQREVLELIAEGHSNREIADKLFLSEGTVKNHVTNLLQSLALPDRTRLAILANRYGLES
ncbi:MAG: response regulator transcription factor [Chrysiogenetes bacterium]|nr:response regulator transcription factor [Chrysiogenetes bacterium]